MATRLRVGFWLVLAASGVSMGCTPEIGDECTISTDCSIRGERLCDTSQPGGYCTQLNCLKNTCPDDALCVMFDSRIPGCGFDDRSGPYGSRVARTFCVAVCESNDDCRSGYVCANPLAPAWKGILLDDKARGNRGCLIKPLDGKDMAVVPPEQNVSIEPVPVCEPSAPPVSDIDASAPSVDYPDAGVPSDAGSDGG